MTFDQSALTAIAAIAGSMVGAISSIGATVFGQRLQGRREAQKEELKERSDLYKELIEVAAPLFLDSLEQTAIEPSKMLHFYSVVARIRLISGNGVLRAAENMGRDLLDSYEKPIQDIRLSSRKLSANRKLSTRFWSLRKHAGRNGPRLFADCK